MLTLVMCLGAQENRPTGTFLKQNDVVSITLMRTFIIIHGVGMYNIERYDLVGGDAHAFGIMYRGELKPVTFMRMDNGMWAWSSDITGIHIGTRRDHE